jgi:4-hydroxy-4-methyl-2-oxoglutarate aldolase
MATNERSQTYASLEAAAAAYGVSTMFEAAGRTGLIDLDLIAHLPEAKVAGRARTVFCGQDDNLMVPAAIAQARPGDILVMRMPESRPVSLLGELLATQCLARGVAAVLVDAAIRDAVAIRELGLPVWSRYVRARSASKRHVGALDAPLEMGGTTIEAGDLLVLDGDGALAVPASRAAEVVAAAAARDAAEAGKRERYRNGELSYDLDGLRAVVEGGAGSG